MSEAASQNPDKGPPNRQRDVVTRFVEEYGDVIVAGQIQMEHTATEGWLSLYAGMRENDIRARISIAAAMIEFAGMVKDPAQVTHPEDMKPIGDTKKRLAEHITMMGNWRSQTVDPVRRCVDDAHSLIRKYRRMADEIERENTLTQCGLLDLMKEAIAQQPRLDWDEKTGQVIVIPPKA